MHFDADAQSEIFGSHHGICFEKLNAYRTLAHIVMVMNALCKATA